jgi:hypothetical protein
MIIISHTYTINIIKSENKASTIEINKSKVTFQIVASLTDDSRDIIYNHNMFIIVQATRCFFWLKRVLDRGPKYRESKMTVLCQLIIIILVS